MYKVSKVDKSRDGKLLTSVVCYDSHPGARPCITPSRVYCANVNLMEYKRIYTQ